VDRPLPSASARPHWFGVVALALVVGFGAPASSLSETGGTAPRVIVSSDFPPLDVIPGKACGSSPPERCSDPDERFLGKLRLFLIAKQDGTAQWLLDTFPKLFMILSEKNDFGMFWDTPGADPRLADLAWIEANIRQGHGPLGAVYPPSGWDPAKPGVQEGDTPSFLHLVSAVRGLNDPEKPEQGGWGGRFVRPDASKNHWFDDPAGPQTVSRWRAQVQAEFAERAHWMRR
jgi:hypothetical protein